MRNQQRQAVTHNYGPKKALRGVYLRQSSSEACSASLLQGYTGRIHGQVIPPKESEVLKEMIQGNHTSNSPHNPNFQGSRMDPKKMTPPEPLPKPRWVLFYLLFFAISFAISFAVWFFFAASVSEIQFRELSWKTPEQKSRVLTACFTWVLQQTVFCRATDCPFQHGVFPVIFRGPTSPRAVRITASEKVSGTILGFHVANHVAVVKNDPTYGENTLVAKHTNPTNGGITSHGTLVGCDWTSVFTW